MMKNNYKRKLSIFLIILILFILYSLKSLIPNIYFNAGKNAYIQKDYKNALSSLETAHKLNPSDKDIRYYYVETLIKLPPTLKIQKALFKLSQENEADSADLIADRQISKWRNQISSNSGENYIEQVPYNNKILRWDITKFPLKVKIENESRGSTPEYYETQIKKAFLQWQASTGFITFKFVDSNPDISVKISPLNIKNCDNQDCKYVVAEASPTLSGNILKLMTITFFDSNNLGKPFTQREIYNTAIHEIGHSLGIMGHSYNKDDIMYMENHKDEIYDAVRSDFQSISPVDLNTISLLYKLIPDITNTNLADFDTRKQFFAPIVMGDDAQINSRKMLEAQNYINAAPNLPNGYIDLAAAYVEQKEYNSAIETLDKALNVSSNDNERFIIYYNLAIVYMNLQNWEDSLKYAQMAKNLKPSEEIDGLIAGINFNKGNKDFAKQAYIDSLAKNPTNILDAVNLARIYLREYNLVQAGKTLNNLIKANPNAESDPMLKPYKLLIIISKSAFSN